MLLSELVEPTLPLCSTSRKLLDLSTKDFFLRMQSFYTASLTEKFVDNVNYLLFLLEEGGHITTEMDRVSKSGVKFIATVTDESLILHSTLEVLQRKRKVVQDNALSDNETKATHELDVVVNSLQQIDTLVAIKYIKKQENAMSRGIEFNLTFNQLKKVMLTKRCYYTGVILELEGDHKLTIERLDSSKGYVVGNVVACSKIANDIKNKLIDDGLNINKIGVKGMVKMLNKFAETLEINKK